MSGFPLPSFFSFTKKKSTLKKTRRHRQPHHGAAAPGHLLPNQGHHELLLVTLNLLDPRELRIELEINDEDHFSISAAGRNPVFPASSVLARLPVSSW
jgi:hypothetical protein